MNGLLKFSLGVGVSLVLASCHSLPEHEPTASPAENQIVLVAEDQALGNSAKTEASYRFAYHVPEAGTTFSLAQEVYQGGRLISQHPALTMSQIDSTGQLVLAVEPLDQGDYLVKLKISGNQVNAGALTFQVKGKQAKEGLQTYRVTLAEKENLDATTPQALFALKFSEGQGEALSAQFLKAPQEHLAEVGPSDLVYLYRGEFKLSD